jgi:hypothetical protein
VAHITWPFHNLISTSHCFVRECNYIKLLSSTPALIWLSLGLEYGVIQKNLSIKFLDCWPSPKKLIIFQGDLTYLKQWPHYVISFWVISVPSTDVSSPLPRNVSSYLRNDMVKHFRIPRSLCGAERVASYTIRIVKSFFVVSFPKIVPVDYK